jgi:TonB family protein
MVRSVFLGSILAAAALPGCGTPAAEPPRTKGDPYAAYRNVPEERLRGGDVPNPRLSGTISHGPDAELEECFTRWDVRAFLHRVRKRMYDRWELPPGIPGDTRVEVRFRLRADGRVDTAELDAAEADPALGESALAALRAAEPFSDPPDCLVDTIMVGTFRNPTGKAP